MVYHPFAISDDGGAHTTAFTVSMDGNLANYKYIEEL